MFNGSIKLICVYMRCKGISVSAVNSKLLQNGLFDDNYVCNKVVK